jgi:hypothetical protein
MYILCIFYMQKAAVPVPAAVSVKVRNHASRNVLHDGNAGMLLTVSAAPHHYSRCKYCESRYQHSGLSLPQIKVRRRI